MSLGITDLVWSTFAVMDYLNPVSLITKSIDAVSKLARRPRKHR